MKNRVPPLSPTLVKKILNRYDLHLAKGFGQHFLIDDNIRRRIIEAARLQSQDHVLEVGAGIGTLTVALADKCRQVTAIELDSKLLPALKDTISPFNNIKVLATDAVKLSLADLGIGATLPNKLVSNLPYNIAAPIIIKYLENFSFLNTFTVMVQSEIAERILAAPGRKKYGAYTVKLEFLAASRLVLKLSRDIFLPPPRVDSAVVQFKRRDVKFDSQARQLFKLIESAFSQRRKQLVNSVNSGLNIEKAKIAAALTTLDISADIRAESLSLDDFIDLYQLLYRL